MKWQKKRKKKNLKYDQLCNNRAGNDMYVQRGVQTFNDALKTKEMQTTPVDTKEIGLMASNWDMFDTYNVKAVTTEDDGTEEDMFSHTTAKQSTTVKDESINPSKILSKSKAASRSYVTESSASFISSSSVTSVMPNDDEDDDIESERSSLALTEISSQLAKVMKTESMKEHLFTMERTVVQNLYHTRQTAYRGLEELNLITVPVEETEEEETNNESTTRLGPNLSRLWSYECYATKGMSVNCMVWNKVNQDLLAVGYGENGTESDGKGLACIWSIKNPEHPERLFKLASAVTSLDFSVSHPNFLAVGLYNGTIAIYNIRNVKDTVVLDSIDSVGKHSSPVWQLKWIERDKGTGEEKGEVLVSTSADGRVTQWSIRKGFEYLDLMKLKRQSRNKQTTGKKNDATSSSKKSDALISRYAAGMCFDFHSTDGNIYLAGTEEGNVHRCSCSYNEQFMETYIGHKGPVYHCIWSPFDSDVFLTCSADWSVRLWHSDKTQPVLTFQSSTKSIIDIDWSPISAAMFVAINENQIEIWDLSTSILDPLLVNLPVNKVKLTAVKFALNSQALLVGDSTGHVTIYQLREMNLKDAKEKNTGWLSRIMNSTTISNTTEEQTKFQVDEGVDR